MLNQAIVAAFIATSSFAFGVSPTAPQQARACESPCDSRLAAPQAERILAARAERSDTV